MPYQDVAPNATGNTGALASATLFVVFDGTVQFSTDAGATYVPFGEGGIAKQYIFPSGANVFWKGDSTGPARFGYMPG